MILQVSKLAVPPTLCIQADAAALLTGFVLLGTFDHDQPVDEEYGYLGNHVIQQHIRDVAYKNGIQDMGRYDVIDMVNKTMDGKWRDFFVTLKDDRSGLAEAMGTPMFGTHVVSASQTTANRLRLSLAGDVKALVDSASLGINSKDTEILTVTVTGGNTIVEVAIPMVWVMGGQPFYLRFRPE